MSSLERELKRQLDKFALKNPAEAVDSRLEQLIADSCNQATKVSSKPHWSWWLAAASIAIVVLIPFGKQKLAADPLSMALEQSSLLETSINLYSQHEIQPELFLEVSRINHRIQQLDNQVQVLVNDEHNKELVVDLLNQRIQQLHLLKDIYQADKLIVQI